MPTGPTPSPGSGATRDFRPPPWNPKQGDERCEPTHFHGMPGASVRPAPFPLPKILRVTHLKPRPRTTSSAGRQVLALVDSDSFRRPNVNPTFSWVRLAQRVPVRIALEHVPPGTQLVAGRTATVRIGHQPPPPRPNTPAEARR